MNQPYDKDLDMESIYQEYANLIYRFLYAHTHDSEWSEELMQETFLRAITLPSPGMTAPASFPYGCAR